jgi:hypothetical protein
MKMGLVTHSDPTFMFFPYVADYAENMKVTPKSVTAVTDWAHAINIRGGGIEVFVQDLPETAPDADCCAVMF